MKKNMRLYLLNILVLCLLTTGCQLTDSSIDKKSDSHSKKTEQVEKQYQKTFDEAKSSVTCHNFYQAKSLLYQLKNKNQLVSKSETLLSDIDDYEKAQVLMLQGKDKEAKQIIDKMIKSKNINKSLKSDSQLLLKVIEEREALNKNGDSYLVNAEVEIQNENFYTAKLYLEKALKDIGLKNKAEAIMTQIDNYQAAQNAWEKGKSVQAKSLLNGVIDVEDGSQEMIYLAEQYMYMITTHDQIQSQIKKTKQNEGKHIVASYIAQAKDAIVHQDFYAARQLLKSASQYPSQQEDSNRLMLQINEYLEAKDSLAQGNLKQAQQHMVKVIQVEHGFEPLNMEAKKLYQQLKEESQKVKVQKNNQISMAKAEDMIVKQNFYIAKQYLKIAVKDKNQKKEAIVVNTQINLYLKAQKAYIQGKPQVAKKEAQKIQNVEYGFGKMTAYADILIAQING